MTDAAYQLPGRGSQTDVFISYSRKDQEFVRRLYRALDRTSRSAWVDWESIPFSVEWWKGIQEGIDATDNLLFVISPDALSSEMCNRELEYAQKLNKRIIPILHRDVDGKEMAGVWFGLKWEDLARANWDFLSRLNWIYFRDADDFDHALRSLLKTTESDDEHTRRHTRLLMRAREWETMGLHPDFLLRGEDLRTAEAWLNRSADKYPAPSSLHRSYIAHSLQNEQAQIARDDLRKQELVDATKRSIDTRRISIILLGVAALFIVIAIVAGYAAFQAIIRGAIVSQSGKEQRTIASGAQTEAASFKTEVVLQSVQGNARAESSRLANLAGEVMQAHGDPQLAALLSIRGLKTAYSPLADLALQAALVPTNEVRLRPDKMSEINNGIAVFNPDGYYVVVASEDHMARLWQLADNAVVRLFSGHTDSVTDAAFSPDGLFIATASLDKTARLWEVASGRELRQFNGHPNGVTSVAFSPDGLFIATASLDKTARVWEVASGNGLRQFSAHTDAVTSVAFSPDGLFIATASLDKTVRLWEVASGNGLRLFSGHADAVTSVAFSPDGVFIVTSSLDKTARLWEVASGQEVRQFNGHTDGLTSAAFSPDGLFIVTSSLDKTARVWEAASGRELRQFNDSAHPMNSAAFSPDGKTIVTADDSALTHLWAADYRDFIDQACTFVERDFTADERRQYGLADQEPTCPQFATTANPLTTPMPTTTPLPNLTLPVWTPIASPTPSTTAAPLASSTSTATVIFLEAILTFTPPP